ncbi:MAG: CdaR family protein [Candidatus Berkelbacteria bacterium]
MKYLKPITNNWTIKLFAILVAFGLWIYAASVKMSIANFPNDIPVKAFNLTPGYVAILDQSSIKISISADSGTWNKLSTDSFAAFIDLNGFTVGTYQLPINVTTSVPGVSIITKNPTKATVTIEPSISKDIPVVAKISGDAAQNMIAGSVIFDPSTVRITGPKSAVDGISQATASITLTGESSDFSKSITVEAQDQKGEAIKNVSFAPVAVQASIKIVSAGNVKNLGVSVITSGTIADGYAISSITTNPPTISVVGAADAIRALGSISTLPVNINNINKTLTVNTNLVFPVGVGANGVSSVSVTILVTNQTLSKTLVVPVSVINLPSGLAVASVSPTSVNAVVSGQVDLINSLSPSSISVTVDLSSATTGSHQYQVSASNFSLPAGVSLINFAPATVTITTSG